MKKLIAAAAMLFFFAFSKGQTIENITPSKSVLGCTQDSFIVKISSPFTSSNLLTVKITLPTGVNFVSASNLNSGTTTVTATSDTSATISITNISGDTLRIVYRIHAECEAFSEQTSHLQNIVTARINSGTIISNPSNTYELNTPFLVLNADSSRLLENTSAPYKQMYERSFYFTNTGSIAFTGKIEFKDLSVNSQSTNALVIKGWRYAFSPATTISDTNSIAADTSLILSAKIFNLAPGDSLVIIERVEVINCISHVNNSLSAYTMNLRYGCINENVSTCELFSNNIFAPFAEVGGNLAVGWHFVDPITLIDIPTNEPVYNCPKDSTTMMLRLINTGSQVADRIMLYQRHAYYNMITYFNTSEIKLFTKSGNLRTYYTSDSLFAPNYGTDQPLFNNSDTTPSIYAQKFFPVLLAPNDTIYAEFTFHNVCLDSTNTNFKGVGIFREIVDAQVYNSCSFVNAPGFYSFVPGNHITFSQNFMPEKLGFDGRPSVQEEGDFKIEGVKLSFDDNYFGGTASQLAFDPSKSLIKIRLSTTPGFTIFPNSISLRMNKKLGNQDTTLTAINIQEVDTDQCQSYIWASFKVPSYFYEQYPGSIYYRWKAEAVKWFNNIDVYFRVKAHCSCVVDPADTRIGEAFYFVLDESCASGCLLPLASVDRQINITCPGCTLPGWDLGGSMTIERKNFGYKDNDNDNHTDTPIPEPADLAHAYKTRAIQGDTLEINASGFLFGGSTLTIGAGSNYIGFPFKYSRFRISGLADVINAMEFIGGVGTYQGISFNIPKSMGTGKDVNLSLPILFSFNPGFASALGRDSMFENDQIHVTLRYRIKDNIKTPQYIWLQEITGRLDMAGITMAGLETDASSVPNLTSQSPSQRDDYYYWCTGAFGGYTSIGYDFIEQAKIGHSNTGLDYIYCTPDPISACSRNLAFKSLLTTGQPMDAQMALFAAYIDRSNQLAMNSFAFEVRDFMLVDSLTTSYPLSDYSIDSIYIYEDNLAPNLVSEQVDYTDECRVRVNYPLSEAVFKDSTVTIYPSRIYQYFQKPKYNDGIQYWANPAPHWDSLDFGDESKRIRVNFVLKLKNFKNMRDSIDMSNYHQTATLYNLPGVLGKDTTFNTNYTGKLYKNDPPFVAEGNPALTNTIYGDTAVWNLDLKFHHENTKKPREYSTADYVFVYIVSPNGHIDPQYVTLENPSSINAISSEGTIAGETLYGFGSRVNPYTADDILNLKVKASFNCANINVIDSVYAYYGWNCYKYPTSIHPDSVCFLKKEVLYLKPKVAGILVDLISDPTASPCDTISYTLDFSATGGGRIFNIKDSVLLPSTLSYFGGSGSIAYSNTSAAITPQISGNYLVWSLNDITALKNNFDAEAISSAQLTFKLATSCTYNLEGVNSTTTATNYCGVNYFLKNDNRTPGTLSGLPIPPLRFLNITVSDFLICDTTATVTVTVKNNDSSPSGNKEFFDFTLANGTYYNNGFNNIRGTTSSAYTQAGQDLKWSLPIIAANDSVKFSFKISSSLCGTVFSYTGKGLIDTNFICASGGNCNRQLTSAKKTISNKVQVISNLAGFLIPTTLSCGTTLNVTGSSLASCKTNYWNFGDGATATTLNAAHFYSGGGTFTVTHIITSRCMTDTVRRSITIITPTAYTGKDTTICSGSSITLTGTVSPSGGTFLWTANGNTVGTTQNITVSPTILTQYILFYSKSSCSASDTVNINVSPFNIPPPSAKGDTICPNTTATLTTTGSLGIYNWYSTASSSTVLGTGSSFTTPVLTNTTTYYVEAHNGTCTSPRTAVTAIVRPNNATANFTFNPYDNSEDQPISFHNTSIGSISTTWNFGDGQPLLLSNADSVTHVFANPGYYQVKISVTGCNGTIYNLAKVIYIIPRTIAQAMTMGNCDCIKSFHYTYVKKSITADTTWTTPITIKDTLTIKAGKTLTITGTTVSFGPQGNVIVEPGALLNIVNGAVLGAISYPSPCAAGTKRMWPGIQVWGDASKNQIVINPLTGKIYQGKIVIANSTIEDSHTAITLSKNRLLAPNPTAFAYNQHYSASNGGIADAQNSNFSRNGTSIKFWEYIYTNRSKVIGCNFTCKSAGVNADLIDPYYNISSSNYPNYASPLIAQHTPFYNNDTGSSLGDGRSWKGIYAHDVRLYNISDNTFEYNREAIKAWDCYLRVVGNQFLNTAMGVVLWNTKSVIGGSTISDHNYFKDCAYDGISISGTKGAKIKLNDFNNKAPFGPQSTNGIGIGTVYSSNFTIVDNAFVRYRIGVVTLDSSSVSSLIGFESSGNQFARCGTGVQTSNSNRGLNIKCNNYDNPEANAGEYYGRNWEVYGALKSQGYYSATDTKAPAGNRYQQFLSPLRNQIFANTTIPFVYFYHRDAITEPIPTTSPYGIASNFTKTQDPVNFDPVNSCKPIIDPKCIKCLVDKITTDQTQLGVLKTEYTTVQSSLDKGQTSLLLTAVRQSPPPGNLKTLLVTNSPLSDTVLTAYLTAPYNVPDGNLKDVMQPNLPVSDKVLPSLEHVLTFTAQGVTDDIRSRQLDNPTYRTLTAISRETEILDNSKQIMKNNAVNHYMEVDSLPLAIALVEQETSIESQQGLAATYISEKNYVAAATKLNSLPANTQADLNFKNLYNLYLELGRAGKTLWDMDSNQEQLVRSIASSCPMSLATVNAQGVLALVFGESVDPCPQNIGSARMASSNQTLKSENFTPVYLGNNVPNPFKDKSTIPYLLPEKISSGRIIISDVFGRVLKIYDLTDQSGIIEVSLENYKNGTYLYSLEVENKILQTKRMVLIK